MRAGCAVVLLSLITTSCTQVEPDGPPPEPRTVATQPAAPPPVATPAAPLPSPPEPAAAPVPRAGPPVPPAAGKGPPPAAKVPAPMPVLDLKALEAQLKDTAAIGIFTKITLKNQVDDLLERFRAYYEGDAQFTITELRRSYDLLLMKILSLLQDEDPALASAIVSSREAIWELLADPATFATLDA